MTINSRISDMRNRTVEERRRIVSDQIGAEADFMNVLDPAAGLSVSLAEHMVENVIGVLGLPVGLATNFTINQRDYLVPMATEEPSVVAAASNAARMARLCGGFTTSTTEPLMQAQVQVVETVDPQAARIRLLEHRAELVELANAQDPMLVRFGGGVRDLTVRIVQASAGTYVVLHLVVDVRDAMGANAVNTMAEAVAVRVGQIAGGRTLLRILTNKADLRLARARATFDREALGGEQVVTDIIHAAAFAEADPYRAATHNKGIMNGISAVVLATGNDTRAVEAGAHSHAVQNGSYTSLSHFEKAPDGNLVGVLELPLAVGLVGGATKVHPVAQAAVAILGVASASELAQVVAAVGLAQNLGALRALASEGIQRGHMSLHARNVAVTAGATPSELPSVVARLISEGAVRADVAARVLAELRTTSGSPDRQLVNAQPAP